MYRNVLFDLDGTITQSEFGIIESIKYSVRQMGMEVKEDSFYLPFIGPPLYDSYQKYCGMTPEQSVEATAYYRAYYCEGAYKNSPVYKGVRELLEGLKKKGVSVYLATAKPLHMAESVIAYHGLKEYFTKLFGPSESEKSPTKVELIAGILKEEGIQAKDTVMVGDRMYDMDGGRANGMDTIGVLYGYGSREELTSHQAIYLAQTPEEVYRIIVKEDISF